MNDKLPAHILIIDDEEINHFIASKLINKISSDIKISSFNNGIAAIGFLLDLTAKSIPLPEFIFVDINMKFMNGWEFLNEYARCYPSPTETKIIMLTSSIFPTDIETSVNHPVKNMYVSKPLTSEILHNLLQ